jgi:hypothetical protein
MHDGSLFLSSIATRSTAALGFHSCRLSLIWSIVGPAPPIPTISQYWRLGRSVLMISNNSTTITTYLFPVSESFIHYRKHKETAASHDISIHGHLIKLKRLLTHGPPNQQPSLCVGMRLAAQLRNQMEVTAAYVVVAHR